MGQRAELKEVLCIPAIEFQRVDGFATTVVSYTTDVPMFAGSLGTAAVARSRAAFTWRTRPKSASPRRELLQAVELYADARATARMAAVLTATYEDQESHEKE